MRELLARGKCKYCGGPASGASLSSPADDLDREIEFTCTPCSAAYSEFLDASGFPQDYPEDEAVQRQWSERWPQIHADAEDYARRKAKETRRIQ